MKYLIVLLLLTTSNKSFSQDYKKISMGGSYMLAAICKDGIVIGADSRGTFLYPNTDSVLAYWDTIPKVFVVKNCILSVAGLVALGDKFLSYYINEFSATLNGNISPPDCIKKFKEYLNNKFPQLKKEVIRLRLFAGGYYKGVPIISNELEQTAKNFGVGTPDDLTNFGNKKKYNNFFCATHSSNEVATLMAKEIKEYPIKQHQTYKIGGPIVVAKVYSNNKITWHQNRPSAKRWIDTFELIRAYCTGKITIHFLSEQTTDYLFK